MVDPQNNQCGPLHSSEAEPLAGFPDPTDLSNIETISQISGDSTQCMRELGHAEAALSVVARISPMGAQTPTYTPIDDHLWKHADPPKLSSQSTFLTVPQQHFHFLPSPPTSSSTKPSPLAAKLWTDERPSGILRIASASTTTVASPSELATLGDERSNILVPLRTHSVAPSSPTPSFAAKTCDYLDPSGFSVSSISATQRRVSLSEDLDLCVATTMDPRQIDNSPDDGTRQLRQGIMPYVSILSPSIFCHGTTVPAAETLSAFPAPEADSAVGTMAPSPTLSTTPLSSVSLPLDARPPHDGLRSCLSVPGVLSDATLVFHRLETPPGDPVIEDETPLSRHLPQSSLPVSQISDFSLNANYADVASASDTEASGSCEGTRMLGRGCAEDNAMAAQSLVVTCNSYVGTSEGPGLSPLGISLDQDMTSEPPASSPPSSSPPDVFSSPTRSVFCSPPSSSPVEPPCNVEEQPPTPRIKDVDRSSTISLLKRAREADVSSETAEVSSAKYRPHKRTNPGPSSQATPPNPTRPTQASRTRQHRKLIAPFRSPVIKSPLVHGGLHAVYASGRVVAPVTASTSKCLVEENATETGVAAKSDTHVPNKDRTARAAKQFKPPMQVANPIASSDSSPAIAAGTVSRVGAVSTIQALQGQVQTLKQAIKIKNSGDGSDDEVLEQLVEKWTVVGREVAWALWDHVKDLDPGTSAPPQSVGWYAGGEDDGTGSKRAFDPGWGCDDEPVRKKARMDEDVDQEEPAGHHTIGIMLRRLGIDPDTLGWNEDEGDFVDV